MFEIAHPCQVFRVRILLWRKLFMFNGFVNMVIIHPQLARKGVSALVFRIPVFELMLLSVVDGLVIFDRVEFLVSHLAIAGRISRTVVLGH